MLQKLTQLLYGNKASLAGFPERHPEGLLYSAIVELGEDPGKELASPDNFEIRAEGEKKEFAYWKKWRSFVAGYDAGPDVKARALWRLNIAEQTSLAEMRAVRREKPDILFIEGSRKEPCSPIGFFAEKLGAGVVYLDDGYEPYFAFLRGKCDEVHFQKGREKYWTRVVAGALDKGKSMVIAGRAHLIPGDLGADDELTKYVGKFPGFVRGERIAFNLLPSAQYSC